MNKDKYLIVECEELGDQWECDANRIPLGIVDDISIWHRVAGYEIYKVKSNGKLEKVKDYTVGDLHCSNCYIIDENGFYVCNFTDDIKILLG